MKNPLRAECVRAMDDLFEFDGERVYPLLQRLLARVHIFYCPRCGEEARQLEICKDILATDFIPPSPSFEDRVMENLAGETVQDETPAEGVSEIPGGISFRAWVFIGFFVLVSLATSFFGIDFITLAGDLGASFLLPLGITVGIVLTGYGAFFIGSHLKELSEHFKLRN